MNLLLKERWMKLSLQEKRIITVGSLSALLFIFYLLIWAPLSHQSMNLRNNIENSEKLLAWMQTTDQRIQSLQKSIHTNKIPSQSTLSLIQHAIPEAGFAKSLTALKQIDAQSIQLALQSIAFDRVISWLTVLTQTHQLKIMQMTVTPTNTPGLVNIEMTLSS